MLEQLLLHFRTSHALLSKPHTGTTNGFRHSTQFVVQTREELVIVCVRMRADAGQVKKCVPCPGDIFEMFKNCFPRCHDLSRLHFEVHMRVIGCHAFREQFVTYAWQMARHGASCASPCRLDKIRVTKTARLGTLYCGALREQNSCQCEACFILQSHICFCLAKKIDLIQHRWYRNASCRRSHASAGRRRPVCWASSRATKRRWRRSVRRTMKYFRRRWRCSCTRDDVRRGVLPSSAACTRTLSACDRPRCTYASVAACQQQVQTNSVKSTRCKHIRQMAAQELKTAIIGAFWQLSLTARVLRASVYKKLSYRKEAARDCVRCWNLEM